MIHVLTVHWKSPQWIGPQLKYISTYINDEYLTYAFCNDIEEKHCSGFNYVNYEDIASHSIKLNLLADMAIFNASSEDDILIFVDGDAFPVRPLDYYIDRLLKKHELIAVKRLENEGDMQPHPSFCMTTVRFWKTIKGDWNSGFHWTNDKGERVTDVGGNLLEKMLHHNVDWYPLIRTNSYSKHPVWFGVYDNTIYHHGAGFRTAVSRTDFPLLRRLKRFVPGRFYRYIHGKGYIDKIAQSNNNHISRMSAEIYDEILVNPEFYKAI